MLVPADVPDDEADDEADDSGASVAVVDTQAAADEVDAEHVVVRGGDETDADDADGDGFLDTPLSESSMTVRDLTRLVARETIAALDDDGMLADDALDGDDEDAEPAVEALGGPRGYQ